MTALALIEWNKVLVKLDEWDPDRAT
jgi:hypothetical protein